MEESLKLLNQFTIAQKELQQMGTIVTKITEVPNGTFTRVSIIIEDEEYHSEHKDAMVATIQLRNQI